MTVAVTFDAGQTLVELDTVMLAARLAERGLVVDANALARAQAAAWRAYDDVVAGRVPAEAHPWQMFMRALLAGGAPDSAPGQRAELAAWLFAEQPRRNLWRRLVPGMIELCDELRAAGVGVAVVSNSEGRLAELLAEVGVLERFVAVADSGALGIEKPAPGIFAWAAARLGVDATALVHVGDSWAADIVGARGVGARAIWFGPAVRPVDDPAIASAVDAPAARSVLVAWGVLPR